MNMAQEIYDRIVDALVKKLAILIESGLTQDDIADKCELTQPTIQRLLAGKRGENLILITVVKIAVAIDIDLGPLFSPDPIDKQEEINILLAKLGKIMVND
jgi:transcriptional regulator with XRE-family HTH domain